MCDHNLSARNQYYRPSLCLIVLKVKAIITDVVCADLTNITMVRLVLRSIKSNCFFNVLPMIHLSHGHFGFRVFKHCTCISVFQYTVYFKHAFCPDEGNYFPKTLDIY